MIQLSLLQTILFIYFLCLSLSATILIIRYRASPKRDTAFCWAGAYICIIFALFALVARPFIGETLSQSVIPPLVLGTHIFAWQGTARYIERRINKTLFWVVSIGGLILFLYFTFLQKDLYYRAITIWMTYFFISLSTLTTYFSGTHEITKSLGRTLFMLSILLLTAKWAIMLIVVTYVPKYMDFIENPNLPIPLIADIAIVILSFSGICLFLPTQNKKKILWK